MALSLLYPELLKFINLVNITIMKDPEIDEVEYYRQMTVKCVAKDVYHIGDPMRQINTLCRIVDPLLKDNEDGKYDLTIGFFGNIAKSLALLIKLQKNRKQHNG